MTPDDDRLDHADVVGDMPDVDDAGVTLTEETLRDGFNAVMARLDQLSPQEARALGEEAASAELAYDAYALGMEYLDRGELDRAARWLRVAADYGITGAADQLQHVRDLQSAVTRSDQGALLTVNMEPGCGKSYWMSRMEKVPDTVGFQVVAHHERRVVREAEEEAKRIIAEAHRRAEEIIAEAQLSTHKESDTAAALELSESRADRPPVSLFFSDYAASLRDLFLVRSDAESVVESVYSAYARRWRNYNNRLMSRPGVVDYARLVRIYKSISDCYGTREPYCDILPSNVLVDGRADYFVDVLANLFRRQVRDRERSLRRPSRSGGARRDLRNAVGHAVAEAVGEGWETDNHTSLAKLLVDDEILVRLHAWMATTASRGLATFVQDVVAEVPRISGPQLLCSAGRP